MPIDLNGCISVACVPFEVPHTIERIDFVLLDNMNASVHVHKYVLCGKFAHSKYITSIEIEQICDFVNHVRTT